MTSAVVFPGPDVTNNLTAGRPEFAARSTDCEVIREDDMLIPITRRDKTFNATQPVEDSRVSMPLSDNPAACYEARKAASRILCGSI